MQTPLSSCLATLLACALAGLAAWGQSGADPFLVDMNAFTVYTDSIGSGAVPSTQVSDRMAREIRVDLQSRGGNRYQTDISIRGGIFEGTGLMVGGLALFDPQTGHYFAEIPLDPSFFGGAFLLTGVENGIHGFNSTAGTINWEWSDMAAGGEAWGRAGSDSLLGGGLRSTTSIGNGLYELAITHESGDGSIDYGDFDMLRLSGRAEYRIGPATVRVFGGFLDKFFGWPGMYTGFPLKETEDYTIGMLGWQLEMNPDRSGTRHRVGGYWREVDDDYEFNRNSPNPFFEHKTEVFSLQGDGILHLEKIELVYRWSMVADRIIRSTSLVNGDFSRRRYGEGAVLVKKRLETKSAEWELYGGFAIDTSNRDSTVVLPQAGLRAYGYADELTWSAYIEYAESSQVPGYTVLNSAPSGLFGGNKYLGRETASTLEAGYTLRLGNASATMVWFRRNDDNLIDWVYDSATPTARQAQPVDIDVSGMESWIGWEVENTAIQAGFIWLDKDETYLESGGDASFYALNFARQRILLTVDQNLSNTIKCRLEAEWRRHPPNPLRQQGDEAMRLHAEISWREWLGTQWDLLLRGNNLTRDDFQNLPGTPAPGREVMVTFARRW